MEERTYRIVWRPVRVFMYLLLLAADFFMILFLGNYFFWVIALVLVVSAAFSIGGLIWIRPDLQIELSAGWTMARRGDVVPVELRVKNHRWIPVLDSKIRFHTVNSFFENNSQIIVSMPFGIHTTSFLRVPLEFDDLGRFEIYVDDCFFQDILGLVECHWNVKRECELFLLPRSGTGEESMTEEYLAGAAETEESKEKGNDFSEVSDIREYVPGDRIRDIHWKLSAKQDNLMVKERVAVAGSEMVIVVDLPEEKPDCEQILETVYQLGKSMIESRMPVCILCWNQISFSFEEFRCGSVEEVDRSFCELYRTPARERKSGGLNTYIKNCYPFLKTYLSVRKEDGIVQVEMCENV